MWVMWKVFLIVWWLNVQCSGVIPGEMQFDVNKLILFQYMFIDCLHMWVKYVWTRILSIKVLVPVVLQIQSKLPKDKTCEPLSNVHS